MKYCEACDIATDGELQSETIHHSELDDGITSERYARLVCPRCGDVLTLDARACQCGEYMSEHATSCTICKRITDKHAQALIDDLAFRGWAIADALNEMDEANNRLWVKHRRESQ